MKFLIASDSFKGCLSSREAGEAMAEGVMAAFADAREANPLIGEKCEVEVMELADGGEGTAEALAHALGAKWVEVETMDARETPMKSGFFVSSDGSTAYLDVASASGLGRLAPELRDLHHTTTYGTGLLLESARRSGVTRIVIGLGGSATIDLGIGILQALGVKFFDESGYFLEEPICGRDLDEIAGYAVKDAFKEVWRKIEIILLSDVTTSLVGVGSADGAVPVFGPQKGLNPDEIGHFEKVVSDLGRMFHRGEFETVNATPGSGAAGGIYVGLKTLGNVKICDGASYLLDKVRFKDRLEDCTLFLTGEGCSDRQTLMGKGPHRAAEIAAENGVPTALLSGIIKDREQLEKSCFEYVININETPMKSAKNEQLPSENPLDPDVAKRRLRAAARVLTSELLKKRDCY